ncbi:MAG: NAD(+)/NADH kinase [Zetaproteobacteria bacterium]|nr:MAG: NAD(+)/NADH kinase [Zetaproteobacteria bacterium]
MKTIGISVKPGDEKARQLGAELYGWLKQHGKSVLLDKSVADTCGEIGVPLDEMPDRANLMVTLGGDGTLLHVSRRFVGTQVPILGINLGRLGFLTGAPAGSMLKAVETVLNGGGHIVHYFSLRAEGWRDGTPLGGGVAINDVVLQRNRHPRMIEYEMKVAGEFVFRVRADGLVLATPAGSTAYALSAGSAIVHPALDAISVAPVCPHTLSNRPIVVPADKLIELKLTEVPAPAALNLDGQMCLELQEGDSILIEKGEPVLLAYLPGRNYYEVLRSKLHWTGREDDRVSC